MKTPRGVTVALRLFGSCLLAGALAACGSSEKSGPPEITGSGDIEGRILLNGAGIPASVVSFDGRTQERRSRLSNDEGLFLFHGAESGTGVLWIAPPLGYSLAAGQPNPVEVVVPDGGVAEVEIRLAPAGTGVDSLTAGTILARAETERAPANGVYVQAAASEGGEVYGATTAGQGIARLLVPEGAYTMTAVVPSWYTLIDIAPASVTVGRDSTVAVLVRVAQTGPLPDGAIEVFVANPDSVPDAFPVPPGVPVTITRTDGPEFIAHAATDSLGRAHFDASPGTYTVSIVVPGGFTPWPNYPNPASVQVSSATSTWARFYLSPVMTTGG